MIAREQCWTCCRHRALCDGRKPTCERCETSSLECLGYGAEVLWGPDDTDVVPNQQIEPPPPPDAIVQSPTSSLYRRAQMIFEGLDYFNKLISPNVVSDASHFNPYIVNLKRLESFPDHYVKVLVATAGFHRLMTAGPEPISSSALIQRDIDVFALRSEALGALNDQLAHPGTQTSDATLLTVVALLITSMQSSAHTEWRAHLEGARRIIQLRGGLKKIIRDNPYFKPILIYFIMADVMGATTCSSRHEKMPVASLMALKYWEIEPNILRLLAATPNPCPEEVFQSIILINYLRTISRNDKLRKRRQSGTRMALAKILRFSPTEYAARMHNFTGWKPNGKDVGFANSPEESHPLQPGSGSQGGGSSSESPSSAGSPSDQDLWLSVAAVYRAAALIYGLRTLVVDSEDDDTTTLLPEVTDVAALREEACQILTDTLTPVFSDQDTMYRIGKLVMWPLFILGMEVHHRDLARRKFFVDGFAMLSRTMGVLGPIGAIDELTHKWALDSERTEGSRVAWDDYFEGRPDYIIVWLCQMVGERFALEYWVVLREAHTTPLCVRRMPCRHSKPAAWFIFLALGWYKARGGASLKAVQMFSLSSVFPISWTWQHLPHAQFQAGSQDDAASDTCNGEDFETSKYQHSAKTLIGTSRFVSGLLADLVAVMVSIAFLAFAVMGIKSQNSEIGQHEETLLNVARIIATGFPYCFALVFGRTLQTIISCRMERGADCLSHAYLSRSLTLGSTLTAPLHIRLGHWLPVVLVILWAFSPLGSQASLRFISLQTRTVQNQLRNPVQYSYPQSTGDSECASCQAEAHNSMFLASFFSIPKTGRAFQDSWGNIKIPLLEDNIPTSNADGWSDVAWHDDLQYSSLIGIPLLLPSGHGNMTFTMESWYWDLDNATLWEANSKASLLQGLHDYQGTKMLSNFTGISHIWQFAIPASMDKLSVLPIPITFVATAGTPLSLINSPNVSRAYGPGSQTIRLEAFLVQRPVELNVTCTISSCNVTNIRTTNMPENYNHARDIFHLAVWFFNHIRAAFPLVHNGTPFSGALEAYLYESSKNPYTVLDGRTWIDLTNVTAEVLARRLTQVINAYWIVDNQFANAAGGFNTSSRPWDIGPGALKNSIVTSVNFQDYIYCDHGWAATLCISSIMLLLAALASAVLSFFRLAPDCTDFLSALTLNDGRLMLEGGSSLNEYERVRLLKDVRLKVGDARSWEQVGQTIIAQDGHVGDLKKKRIYW
ncbi:hypothetical protein PG997_007467 [Apiospora hydei]|uniref:Zn(2)-C6 fungal-type domain-containing protein n=1 Tax=Apiospora hydei TaxID=1337664 RepID=A0ABR1W836_9PEZI